MTNKDIDNLEQATRDLEVTLESWHSLSDRAKKTIVEHVKKQVKMVKRDMEFDRQEKMKEGYQDVDDELMDMEEEVEDDGSYPSRFDWQ